MAVNNCAAKQVIGGTTVERPSAMERNSCGSTAEQFLEMYLNRMKSMRSNGAPECEAWPRLRRAVSSKEYAQIINILTRHRQDSVLSLQNN